MDETKRRNLLLLILYLSFISLGLPDAVLGSAWPTMRLAFGKSLDAAGILQAMTTILSVVSSLAAGILLARIGTGTLIVICCFMTASAMFGYSFSPAWSDIIFFTVFFGLGQGAVDTAVNSYMAKHFSVKHMNWVHCCWGVGATGGPLIMTTVLSLDMTWRNGYLAIGAIQILLALVFLATLGLWPAEKREQNITSSVRARIADEREAMGRNRFLLTAGSGMLFYFLYPGIEVVTGLWSASYLVDELGATPAAAAVSVTVYWGALAAGRFAAGFFANRFANATILRGGIGIAVVGCIAVIFVQNIMLCRLAFILIGVGLSPLYPTMMHETPARVGLGGADRVVGLQVGAALAGAALLPALFGIVASKYSLSLLGYVLVGFAILAFAAHETSFRFSLVHKKAKA